jgi:sulfate adenylyltransferase large subunit
MTDEKDLIRDDIEAYLAKYRKKELLRFVSVGSVDDGKSTLIGRILYDTGMVFEDQMAAVRAASKDEEPDLALLTDGLKAEREQGITIDVAYRYFATDKRKFIIADTPGHIQYTRNMVTGASTADVALILIDARHGVLQQSRRHAYIASLLGIPHLAVCVNKMDLKDYSQEVYEEISADFMEFGKTLRFKDIQFFPISALVGDNVVSDSENTPWYDGPNVLGYLETVPVFADRNFDDFRYPVQYVIRPDLDYRGFAAEVSSGVITKGDDIVALPSGKESKVKAIDTYDGELEEAFAGQSVTIRLEDEIDISRGDMIVKPGNLPRVTRRFDAHLVWMHERPLDTEKAYLVKHTTQTVRAQIDKIHFEVDMDTLEEKPTDGVELNDIAKVRHSTSTTTRRIARPARSSSSTR